MSDQVEMQEIEAMRAVMTALLALDDQARQRVLRWASDRFAFVDCSPSAVKPKAVNELPENAAAKKSEEISYSDLPSLFTAANPSSGIEKVLVVGYFYQVVEKNEDLNSQEINTSLKHLGHGVSNVTSAMTSLMNSRPQLVMQTKKTGSSRQARKKYRLTNEGIRKVEAMLGGSTY